MRKTTLSALLFLLVTACNGERISNTTNSSLATTSVVQYAFPSSANEEETADWTPMFKYLETEGCGHASSDLNTLLESLYDWEIDDRGTKSFGDDRVDIRTLKTPIPPRGFERAVGKQISYTVKGGIHTLSLPIRGTYYGIPVKALERYGLENSGVSGVYLVLDIPLSEAKAKLHNVRYAIPRFKNEEEGMGLFEPEDFQAFLDTNNNGETVLGCVYF